MARESQCKHRKTYKIIILQKNKVKEYAKLNELLTNLVKVDILKKKPIKSTFYGFV